MKILLYAISALFVLIALFLLFAVVNALLSDEGAKAGVAVLYIAISSILGIAAFYLSKSAAQRGRAAA